MTRQARGRDRMWLLPALLLTAAVYFPITRNYFYTSDFQHFVRIADYGPAKYIVMQAGGHITLFRNSIYYLSHLLFGLDPRPYFYFGFLLHLANVALLWWVIRGFTQSLRLAFFGSALWGICLLHEGTLGWWSGHGHVFAATLLLLTLAHLGQLTRRSAPPPRQARLLWYALALLASTSFGVGIGFALVLPLVAVLLLPRWRSVWKFPPGLTLWLVVPVLYVAVLRINERIFEDDLISNTVRLSILERGHNIPVAVARLAAFGTEWLLEGLFPIPPSAAATYLPLALLLLAALLLVPRAPQAMRRQLAACALLTAALYGMIAAGRGFFVVRATREELLQLSYYHYAPLIPVALAICVLLKEGAARLRLSDTIATALLALWTAATLTALVVARPSFDHHDQERAEHQRALADIRCRINGSVPGEVVYFYSTLRAKPFIGAFPSNSVAGHRVFFLVDAPPKRSKTPDLRSKDLYVSRIALTPRQIEAAKRMKKMCAAPARPTTAHPTVPDRSLFERPTDNSAEEP